MARHTAPLLHQVLPGRPRRAKSGNRGCRRDGLTAAEFFAGQGCTVLLVSLRAHGDSSGEFNDLGYSAWRDVAAAVAFLEKECPGRRIIVNGLCTLAVRL